MFGTVGVGNILQTLQTKHYTIDEVIYKAVFLSRGHCPSFAAKGIYLLGERYIPIGRNLYTF